MNTVTNQSRSTEDDLPDNLVKTPMLIIGNHALHAYETMPTQWTSRVYIPVTEFPDPKGDDHA